jgi:hypothetical protein
MSETKICGECRWSPLGSYTGGPCRLGIRSFPCGSEDPACPAFDDGEYDKAVSELVDAVCDGETKDWIMDKVAAVEAAMKEREGRGR